MLTQSTNHGVGGGVSKSGQGVGQEVKKSETFAGRVEPAVLAKSEHLLPP